MKKVKIILSSLCIIFSIAMQAQNCGYEEVLALYQETLPEEKIYAHTDQSFYEPGDIVWFKVYLLDETLAASAESAVVHAELIDPRGDIAQRIDLENYKGSCNGEFSIPTSAPGGQYRLVIYTRWQRNFGKELRFEKKLQVQKNLLPNILMQLDFMRESYGPGSEVEAKLSLRSKDDNPLANHNFEFSLRLEGKKIWSRRISSDDNGQALLRFELPQDLQTADGLLNISVEHQGAREAISRAVPIITRKIDLQFLPEGGHWVVGQKQRLAFKALNEFGQAADVEGTVYDETGSAVGNFRSYHQGMGSLWLLPQAGKSYTARINEPKGLADKVYTLPAAESSGMLLQLKTQDKEGLKFNIYSPEEQTFCVVLQMQNRVQQEISLSAKAGDNELFVSGSSLPMGIAQITVFDAAQIPQAERLVFVNKHRQIKVEIKTDKTKYQIRDSVMLSLLVTDESGKGLAGDFSLAVVDDKNWTFADDKQDNILSKLLLCSDLKGEIYEPSFYFNPKEAKADTALDYVMLTHGWRSFEWRKILKESPEDWEAQVVSLPEPNDFISGRIHFLGQALEGHKIKVLRAVGYKGKLYRKSIKSGKDGYFSLPSPSKGGIVLRSRKGHFVSECGPFEARSSYLDEKKYNEGIIQGSGVYFGDAVNTTNTLHPNIKVGRQYYSSSYTETFVYRSCSDCAEGKGHLLGKVLDENGEPLVYANIALYQGENLVRGTSSDFDGNYIFDNIPVGIYDLVVSYVGYPTAKITGIPIRNGQSAYCDFNYESNEISISTEEVIVVGYQIPLIEVGSSSGGRTLGSEDIKRLRSRDVRSIAATTAGVSQRDVGNDIIMNGSRRRSTGATTPTLAPKYDDVVIVKGTRKNTNEGTIVSNKMRKSNSEALPEPSKRYYPFVAFTMDNNANIKYYQAKSFYAPDYSRYLQLKKYGAKAIRSDFRKTVFWQPYLTTDTSGRASVLFYNSDAVSTFRVIVEGVAEDRAGRAEHTYSVQMPFEIEVKMPKVLTDGDTLRLPVVFRNLTADTISGLLTLANTCGLELLDTMTFPKEYRIAPNSFSSIRFAFVAKKAPILGDFSIKFDAEGFLESQTHSILVQSKGFPREATISGTEASKKLRLLIEDPQQGSIRAKFEMFINPQQALFAALEGMLSKPSGCFEQVSSTNYPNILALQLMKSGGEIDAALWEKAQTYLDFGYKKLEGYECKGGGFDWFGRSPSHEALTAYGLMQFKDMAEVYTGINANMLVRARSWLLSRRNGNGGFMKSEVHYGWGSSQAASNAYITYCLAYIGEKQIAKELAAVTEEALQSKDCYRLGLACLAQFEFGAADKGELLLKIMLEQLQILGIDDLRADQNVMCGQGKPLASELLALTILASLKSKTPDKALIEKCNEKLLNARSGGYFGSTQATVWALKAILAYRAFIGKTSVEKGKLELFINNQLVAASDFHSDDVRNLSILGLEKHLLGGANDIEIRVNGLKRALPYSFDLSWNTLTPESDSMATLSLRTKLDQNSSRVGETVRMEIEIENKDLKKSAPSPMAIIGIPAGLGIQPWQLQAWLQEQKVDFYELYDDRIVLYFRKLEAGEKKQLFLDLKAELPGSFLARSSNAYLYYNDNEKDWKKGELIEIE